MTFRISLAVSPALVGFTFTNSFFSFFFSFQCSDFGHLFCNCPKDDCCLNTVFDVDIMETDEYPLISDFLNSGAVEFV